MSGALVLYRCEGGTLSLPSARAVLGARQDGGHLVVGPPRAVWDRSALSRDELTALGFLVAAAGEAMLAVLPQLDGGCINYWDAGNWALNDEAEPKGPKTAPAHRNMHLHLLGRSRHSDDPDYRWGESPRFPRFVDKEAWSKDRARLGAEECAAVVARTDGLLRTKYAVTDGVWKQCGTCGYPAAAEPHGCS